ncbi:hypothetical protein ELH33_33080 (plasmid) [Rhizobium ruizarguesonis]|uniref:hypothetical protein n=1 Tax=Rhizobium ruizarguesonis TaxID=2081791 RepID=UPI0010326C00|nr:hypothetical protein [Rhizobium ruizarguesonis]TBC25610.1 hypothetical protein ELH33_33080 [Rhizobium ruizarguesonis]
MHPLFTITKSEIKLLTDEQAREVVARLCMAELEAKALPRSAVSWGGNQRAADGGVDIKVELPGSPVLTGYIPTAYTAFQVKAEKFGPAKVTEELAPQGKLRELFSELAARAGGYVIVSTHDDVSEKHLKPRLTAMTDALKISGLDKKVETGFYDSQKVADWVGSHPMVALWVREILGRGMTGWKPYGAWAYKESDPASAYLIDDDVVVIGPSRAGPMKVLDAINALRGLASENANIRLVGLSGVGKTRLVQALFDERISTENRPLNKNAVVYCDFSEDVAPPPLSMLDALKMSTVEGTLIVDNCSAALHSRLAAENSKGKPIRLITIEHDVGDDSPEDTAFYRIRGTSDDILKQLLTNRYPYLTAIDCSTIAAFSDGNVRVAFALASTATRGGELAALHDNEMFRRLFQQNNQPDPALLLSAETMSLLYSFDGEDLGKDSEIGRLAGIADVSIKTLNRHVNELKNRGLVQERSKWRAVLPQAIANRLAASALEALPENELIAELLDGPDRMARSFSRRLGYLHESSKARSMAASLMKKGGRLGDLFQIDDLAIQMFVNLAPLAIDAALSAVECACRGASIAELRSDRSSSLTKVARAAAYDPALFDRAATVLLMLSREDEEKDKHGSPLEALKSLFHCFQSGTHAPIARRTEYVARLLESSSEVDRQIGLSLLETALSDWNASQTFEQEFGAHKRDYGWWPASFEEMSAWYQPFINLAATLSIAHKPIGSRVRLILAEALRGLLSSRAQWAAIETAVPTVVSSRPWPEGWLALKRIATYDSSHFAPDTKLRLEKLIEQLKPRDLETTIRAKILGRGSFTVDDDIDSDDAKDFERRHARAQEEAKQLGELASRDPHLLDVLLPDLLDATQGGNKIQSFATGLGGASQDPHRFLETCRSKVSRGGVQSLGVVVGFLQGWKARSSTEVDAFLDQAINNDVWVELFPLLQCAVGLTGAGYSRLLICLSQGKTPVERFRSLMYGRVTDAIDVEETFRLVDDIATRQGGEIIAAEILHMVIHCAEERGEAYKKELGRATTGFMNRLNWDAVAFKGNVFDVELSQVISFSVKAAGSFSDIEEAFDKLVAYGRATARAYREFGQYAAPYFRFFPAESLGKVYQPDTDGRYRTALRLVGNQLGRNVEIPIKNMKDESLLAWCRAGGHDRFIFASQTCRLFDSDESDDGESAKRLSTIAVALLNEAASPSETFGLLVQRIEGASFSGPYSVSLIRAKEVLGATKVERPEVRELVSTYIEGLERRITERLETEAAEEQDSQNVSFE